MGDSLQTPPSEIDTEPLPCPSCGYDLRASTADQCSECGQAIDRSALGITSLPWPHRHTRGRIRSYCKTVWLITANSSQLKFETLKDQDLADARSFNRITTFIVALTLSASCAALLTADPLLFVSRNRPRQISWLDDVLVPWLAGIAIRPVIPAMLLLVAIHLTTIHRRLFRLKSASPRMQKRASAISHYATAPLAALLPLAILTATTFGLIVSGIVDHWGFALVTYVWILFAVILFPLTLVRILQWLLRLRSQSWERSLLHAPKLIGLWLLTLFLDLFFLPWCIGLIWIAIDSFR